MRIELASPCRAARMADYRIDSRHHGTSLRLLVVDKADGIHRLDVSRFDQMRDHRIIRRRIRCRSSRVDECAAQKPLWNSLVESRSASFG